MPLPQVRQRTQSAAHPKPTWAGFQPTTYSLNVNAVWELPLRRQIDTEKGSELAATKVGAEFEQLQEAEIRTAGWCFVKGHGAGLEVVTDSQKLVYVGPEFPRAWLRALLQLHRLKVNAFEATWCWFDHDGRGVSDQRDTFFVVAEDRIVAEMMQFPTGPADGFDPSLFEHVETDRTRSIEVWKSEPEWRDAWAPYLYRKFYRETQTGQLMVLRPDEPPLFFYPEGRGPTATDTGAAIAGLQGNVRRLQWLAVILAGLVLTLLFRH